MKKILKNIIKSILLCGTTIMVAFIPSFADVNFDRNNGVITYGGQTYYHDTIGGLDVYTRYSAELEGNKNAIGQVMLLEHNLPGMRPGSGGKANTAAFRYKGFEGIRSGAQYLTKYTMLNPYVSDYEWQAAPYNISEQHNVNFRYAGIALNSPNVIFNDPYLKNIPGMAATNPTFTSDWIQERPSGGETRTATLYSTKDGTEKISGSMVGYGNKGDIYDFSWFYSNGMYGIQGQPGGVYPATGNIRSNEASNLNKAGDAYVEKVFTEWAERDPNFGARYKEKAEQTAANERENAGLPWIQWYHVLNRYFRIDGNIDDPEQSVFLYCVCNTGGKNANGEVFYRTYTIPAPMQNNVSPTRLVIRDENDKVLGNAYRNPIELEAYGGVGNPQSDTQIVSLERGKIYSISGILSYYNIDRENTKNLNRSADFYAQGPDGTRYTDIGVMNTSSTIEKSGLGDPYAQYIDPDGKSGGQIATDYYVYSIDTPEKIEYWCGDAAFQNISFQVTDSMPVSGKLVLKTPISYNESGDNDNTKDDTIAINYIIGASPDPVPPTTQTEAYGDMNIGQREYRRLHWYTEEEVEDPDSPITDPATGEVTGYEMKTIIMEHISDYGTYEDTGAAQGAEDESFEVDDTSHEVDDKDRFDAGNDMWWEYAQEWPDQTEDLDWKVWMERNGQWQEDGHYIRSETVDEPFDLGFYISRSRGKEGVVESPTLDVNIYGISPDTGEDGELIANMSNMQLTTPGLSVYTLAKNYLKGLYVGEKYNGVADYPRIRVDAKISDKHGESGIYGDARKQPYNNGWQDEHDTVSREFLAEEDDMRIMEVELKDSEGVVVYHADRYGSDNMDVTVNGHFDREEDLTMKVVVEQNLSSGHNVKNPTIDVRVDGLTETGNTVSTYVDQVLTLDGVEMGEGVQVTFDNISFRPKNVQKLSINAQIDDIHGENNWRENIWDDSDDSYNDIITCTTADMSLTQDIELYNSKHNKQEYLTFAEYLSFKFNIRHIGNSERQMMVVGNSKINPLAKLNTKIYNADALTVDPHTQKLVYKMASEDPKASKALISEQDIQAKTRLFPGLGLNGYASHVQAWIEKYIVQTWKTPSGNVAAYGHILVSGIIDQQHDINYTNIRDNTVDYVQKEFKGEKDFRIEDITATAQNSISDKTGVSVQVAISNIASSYNDQTVIDKTYLDIYIDDESKTTSIIEVPTGETIITEIIIPEVDLEDCKVIEARVNTGTHQTHYEYVLKETNDALHTDPFTNNYASTIVCSNKPSETVCPQCILQEGQNEVKDIFVGDGD